MINIIFVFLFTIITIAGLATVKNSINKSEAIRAMKLLGQKVLSYRQKYGSLPSQRYAMQFINEISAVRLMNLQYRAQWIEYGANVHKTVLAYSKKDYKGLVKAGYIVLWLDGRVEWMKPSEFELILRSQQKKDELDYLKERFQKRYSVK